MRHDVVSSGSVTATNSRNCGAGVACKIFHPHRQHHHLQPFRTFYAQPHQMPQVAFAPPPPTPVSWRNPCTSTRSPSAPPSRMEYAKTEAPPDLTGAGGAAFAVGQPKGGSNLIACACHFHRLQSLHPEGRGELEEKWLWENVDGTAAVCQWGSADTECSCAGDFMCGFTVNPPPQRPWLPLAKPNKTRPACIFTVMCYNVLCDKYATRQMYGYCPSWALCWEYRKKSIIDEIRHYAADIISLQEIETEQFYHFFLPELKNDGYEGIFSPKSRAKTMSELERKYVDGCAIFFRASKFTLIKESLIEFNQLAMANAEGSDNMLNRVMPKDNIGLAALLKVKENAWEPMSEVTQISQPLLVCTAHIHWDPEFCDVKLIQTMMLSNELKTIIDEASHSFRPGHKNDSNAVQLLLCGDFNSLPDSGVVEFLGKGRVNMDHLDFKDMGYKSCLQRLLSNDTNEFTHSFKLASAYSEDIMPHTNYTFDFKGIIDYIFYTKTGMVPLGLLGPVSNDWLRENKVVGCPHPHIPSDHFPLLVELELMHTASQQAPPNGLINRR
ncbi:hypothetical protein M5D96_002545 [Drosophila gunungcola]|uniref:poly(A)-specific ribonuclease n=1 Tax=Drosophila gunungcola TaxID=103775 RepID=A0A9P9Z0Y8_9MUSC|nr:hypothetical protein M5D96_002545 [Drosophila gunungcola]